MLECCSNQHSITLVDLIYAPSEKKHIIIAPIYLKGYAFYSRAQTGFLRGRVRARSVALAIEKIIYLNPAAATTDTREFYVQ
jgi:hypothetical protein